MYKLIVTGAPGAPYVIDANIPYPFETVGANPVRAPADNSLVVTSPTNGIIKLADYGVSPQLGVTTRTVSMNGNISSDGSSEITIHLRYGLLGTPAYTPLGDLKADTTGTIKDIPNYAKYNFVATETTSGEDSSASEVIESENKFQKVAGFGGVVKDINEDPVKGAKVLITGPGLPAAGVEVTTDTNGYYQHLFKYTGKSTSFTIKLKSSLVPLYSEQIQIQTAKSNSYVITNFTIPSDVVP
jgi:hypothetical protein